MPGSPSQLTAVIAVYYFFSLVNFEPSIVAPAISPFWPKTNPTTGCLNFFVSKDSSAPTLTKVTLASTPARQFSLLRNFFKTALSHEDKDDVLLLASDLIAERSGNDVVVTDRFPADP